MIIFDLRMYVHPNTQNCGTNEPNTLVNENASQDNAPIDNITNQVNIPDNKLSKINTPTSQPVQGSATNEILPPS